jgi:hypothetical protein
VDDTAVEWPRAASLPRLAYTCYFSILIVRVAPRRKIFTTAPRV